ncbi:MAG: rod shape-determining protein RodA [Lachnospiraceae bacterium]|nr:rod shape-determining protein RodA [Lachnospiraceae bacterium]
MLKRYSVKNYNFLLLLLVIAQTVYGIVAIGSAREAYQTKQIEGLIIGLVGLVILSLIDYSLILNFYWVLYGGNILLLTAVIFLGSEGKGAQRWLEIGSFRFQPSELAKILLILFFAQFIMKHREKLNTFKVLLQLFGMMLIPLVLVFKQPDLSTTIMILIIFCALLFIGGLSIKLITAVLVVFVPVAAILLMIVIQPDQKLIKDYQQTRILAWLQPDKYSNTEGYQQQNSMTAIGSGRLTGKGYKNNEVASVKNGNFISEPQTDFIFAMIGEDLGFAGCVAVIFLQGCIVFQILGICRRAKDLAGRLICAGVAANIGFQSFMNIAVTTGLMPNTGIPLPFISYGSTSMVSLCLGVGLVLNVGLQPLDPRDMRNGEW